MDLQSNKPLTITQIIDAFPDECKELIPRVNRSLKKELKPYLNHCKCIRNKYYDNFTEGFLLQVIKIYYRPGDIEKVMHRNKIILDSMNTPDNDKITDLMIERAKDTPIVNLYEFEKIKSGNARFFARCPFHSEKTGSFCVYPNNTYYCFGCHVGG